MSKFANDSTPNKKFNPKKKQMREITFVNITLSDAQLDAVGKQMATNRELAIDPLDQLVMGGYKVSINVDWENQCYIVSATGGERTVNEDKCCSSRSDDLEEALNIMLYKAFPNGTPFVWEDSPRRFNRG